MSDNSLLLAFYGDDFTGSTDAMEALASSGFRTVLFTEAPTREMLQQFDGLSCIGVAGTSRAKNPDDMERELRPVFERLSQLEVPVIHYKVCSTFDSSPEVGSIGKAIEVGREYLTEHRVIPVLVGAPSLGRFTLFGQHFARMNDQLYRLDRHPTMSRHPVTPMREADLRLHLGRQIAEDIGLMNILELEGEPDAVRERFERKLLDKPGIMLFDVLDETRLRMCGQLIWEEGGNRRGFVVGSSGVEYALTAYWKSVGIEPRGKPLTSDTLVAAERLLVVSGSASPVTQEQIETALRQGFHGIQIHPERLVEAALPEDLLQEACLHLNNGRSVVMYTALGPEDDMIAATRARLNDMGIGETQAGEFIGKQLGIWTREVIRMTGIRRIVVAGGDTSGFVIREMDVFGLEMLAPVSPGAPLCRAYSMGQAMNGIELCLKGGQMGSADFFIKVQNIGFKQ